MRSAGLLAIAASLSTASAAAYKGFNYGATKSDGYAPRAQSDFQALFQASKGLVGASGFTSARLYTTIQAGTTSDPTSAIPAAIAEDISLLVTLWASGNAFPNELTAFKAAIAQYGSAFTDRVAGISIGSEDLYRNSPTGIQAGSTIGANPDTIVDYIKQVRSAIAGTALSAAPVGHVDTWTAWVNGSNQAVIDNCDWIGVDAYPYFQNTQSNAISSGASLFNEAVDNTVAAVGGKPVWITETGWPVSGKTENLAIPNTQNAETYWKEVGCPRFNVVNTWWYTLTDTDNNASPNPSFGLVSGVSTAPLFDLSCDGVSSSSSSAASSSASASASASGSSSAAGASTTAASSAASASSAVSSASTALTGGTIVSAGGGLSPTRPAVDGSAGTASATSTGSSSGSTGVSGGSGNSTLLTTATPTGTRSGSSGTASTSLAVATGNSAATLSGSIAGVMGALLAAVVVL